MVFVLGAITVECVSVLGNPVASSVHDLQVLEQCLCKASSHHMYLISILISASCLTSAAHLCAIRLTMPVCTAA